MAEESTMQDVQTINKGDIVKGRVTQVEDGQAMVDVGYKYEGVIPVGELSSLRIERVSDVLSVGDEVEVKVLRIQDEEGKMILSKRAVDSVKAWDTLEQYFQEGTTFDVVVADVVKGGLVADVGVRAFIPASLVERHFVEDFSSYKGKHLALKVVEFERENNKVILSHRAVEEEESLQNQSKIYETLQPGEVVEGTVQRLTPFGVFVDVGGVDGLVHISELAWNRVESPSDVVKEGDLVRVKVLRVDPDKGRISLSIKEAQPGPWAGVEQEFHAGQVATGIVRRLVNFGAFVELKPGVEGLVHISQISNQHIGKPEEVLEVGQEVKVKVLDVSEKNQRISLSIRDAEHEKPRKETKQQQRTVESYTNNNTQGTGVTLGDMFGDLFKNNK